MAVTLRVGRAALLKAVARDDFVAAKGKIIRRHSRDRRQKFLHRFIYGMARAIVVAERTAFLRTAVGKPAGLFELTVEWRVGKLRHRILCAQMIRKPCR